MPTDFALDYGSDFGASAGGDFATASDDVLSRQRVIRLLITNSRLVLASGDILLADYPYHTDYGESLGRKVGSDVGVSDQPKIVSIVTTALRSEDSVDQTQPINVTTTIVSGGVRILISYTSAWTGNIIRLPALQVS
jgi:hypothetical protein